MFKGKNLKLNTKIAGATMVIIFSLAAAFSGTIAWFSKERAATVTAGSFQVVAPEGTPCELYYLEEFTDEEENTKPGNYNPAIHYFSGYEVDYDDATFTQVTPAEQEENNQEENEEENEVLDPTDIRHLWPAHKLTFALVTSGISALTITDWAETQGLAKTSEQQYVQLSWAIDIYGYAYNVTASGNTPADIASVYDDYRGEEKSDVFNYSEVEPATGQFEELAVVEDIDAPESGERTIVFFTIEFSNAPSTFYRFNKTTGFYNKDVTGNSNCYEGLSFSRLEFSLS